MTLPPALRWSQRVLACLAVLQVVVAILFLTHRQEVIASWVARDPEFSPQQIDEAVKETILGGVVLHLAIAGLYGWLALAVVRPRRWIHRVATASLVIGTVAGYLFLKNESALIPTQVIGVTVEQILSLVLRLVALWLIWAPREVRRFFAAPAPSDTAT